MTGGRRGGGVVEAVVALLLGFLLLQLGLAGLSRMRAGLEAITVRSEQVTAVRTVRWVLRNELGAGVPGLDWTTFTPDSLRLRAFRGLAVVCDSRAGAGTLTVGYRGVRAPDPDKDSVDFVTEDGTHVVVGIHATTSADGCGEGPPPNEWRAMVWSVDSVPERVVLGRVFERGSYHLSGGAFRYRRGGGGRQPLTPEVFATPPSGFIQPDAATLDVELWLASPASGEPVHLPVFRRP